ncbi:hypothetical protein UFOVP1247_71 [uncultured Caudovirales phage]|uniref:Uncharacterized protein n=1 Tax=uncultured Caudovirales phage TaxID=2100421 RepID=A0A6J5PSY9_9CAUD|nr:hypothetical protein UFOVP970_111 [uncultured Caudovirales phage]CAB4193410.1 hypothetical protein UFOVP1247_71 [uncultured Caudovirales phage]
METTHSIWGVLDKDGPLKGIKTSIGNNCMLFDVSQDTDDGTYPTVASYTRDANGLDGEGASHFINRLTRKKNKLEIEYDGVKIIRDSKWDNQAILEFKEPIEVVIGQVGDKPIIEKVTKIGGEFTHDWFWTKNGRQDKIANGYEIWFVIGKYIA